MATEAVAANEWATATRSNVTVDKTASLTAKSWASAHPMSPNNTALHGQVGDHFSNFTSSQGLASPQQQGIEPTVTRKWTQAHVR